MVDENIQISRAEVELRWYEYFKGKFEKDFPILFRRLEQIIIDIINLHKFPLYLNESSPKFAKKYLSIYEYQCPKTGKRINREFLTRDLINNQTFKETLEKKAYGAIIYRWHYLGATYNNQYYLGITVDTEENRFAQHIADSIIRYSTKKRLTKKLLLLSTLSKL